MTAADVPHIARHLLNKHGLDKKGWTFKWDSAHRRAGYCRYLGRTISLSRHYVELNIEANFDDVVDTILHEIAHALCGPGKGHGDEWKVMCTRIGARPERCFDATQVEMPQGRYQATCGGCGRKFSRCRPMPAHRWSYCKKCGKQEGRLMFVDQETVCRSNRRAADELPQPKKLR